MRINNQIFERLVTPGDTVGSVEPQLAESYAFNADNTEITFKIRKDVKFHNGETLTVDDVVASFHRMATETAAGSGKDWLDFQGVTATDDTTVVVPLKSPVSVALGYLSTDNCYILSKKTMEEYGEKINLNPIGTGPFKVINYMQGDRMELERFDDYWDTVPKIKYLNFRFISEASQGLIELETGGADVTLDVAGKDVARVESSEGIKLISGKSVCTDLISFNCTKAPFDNVLVRQAASYAIDKDAIFRGIYFNNGKIAHSPVTSDTFAFDTDLGVSPRYPYDVEKAKELMKQAGYENGVEVELFIDDNPTRIAVAEMVQNQLAQVGIKVSIRSQDYATWFSQLYAGEENLFIKGENLAAGDPDKFLFLRGYSGYAGGGTNIMNYNNPEFDAKLIAARESSDPAEREQLWKDSQQIFMEDAPAIPFYERPQQIATAKNLEGIGFLGETYLFKDCYFE